MKAKFSFFCCIVTYFALISRIALGAQLKNQVEIKQDTNRIDFKIELDSQNREDRLQVDRYIQVEISFQNKFENSHNRLLEQDDIYFCLSNILGSQCVNSEFLDIYQQNFRSNLLFIEKEIPDNVQHQYATVIISDQLMQNERNKLIYTIRWQSWEEKPLDKNLRCPFDCSQRGQCVNGICQCNLEYVGRSCEFNLRLVNVKQKPWIAQMESGIQWISVNPQDDIILLDFKQGLLQVIVFTDFTSFQISSQYLLSEPQKIILDKKYIQKFDQQQEYQPNPNNFLGENNSTVQQKPLLFCFYSYKQGTNFQLTFDQEKINDILSSYDKELFQNDPETQFLNMLTNFLIFLVILSSILLAIFIYKYTVQKKKVSTLMLYKSKKFSELHSELQLEDSCRICLEKYQSDTEVRYHYKCKKVFHKTCFDRWALTGNNRKCPQCRMDYEPILLQALQNTLSVAELTNLNLREPQNEGAENINNLSQISLNIPFVNQNVTDQRQEDASIDQTSQYQAPNQISNDEQASSQVNIVSQPQNPENEQSQQNKEQFQELVDDDEDSSYEENEEEKDQDENDQVDENIGKDIQEQQTSNLQDEDTISDQNQKQQYQKINSEKEKQSDESDDEQPDIIEETNDQIEEKLNANNQQQQIEEPSKGKLYNKKKFKKNYTKIQN